MNRRTFISSGAMAATSLFVDRRVAWSQVARPAPGATVETTAGKIRGLALGKVQAF